MIISEILDMKAIMSNMEDLTKVEVIKSLVDLVYKAYDRINSRDKLVRILLEREKLKSTGIEDGLAIPHGKHAGLKKMVGALVDRLIGCIFGY